jgi:type III restriction enzyme
MPRRRRNIAEDPEQLELLRSRVKTAPAVPAIRKAVSQWRAGRYVGATDTSKLLLNHWFHTDHRLPNGQPFVYHDSQREAIETLIYVYEIARARRLKDLLETYVVGAPELQLLQTDPFPRYAIKMATGSGKTKVMSLAVVWQYFAAVNNGGVAGATTFLVLAPNVIVFERLRTDFAGGRIFRADPLIPKELEILWDFQCYLRGDSERASSTGALYLTNIQQLYDRPDKTAETEPEEMTAVMGSRPRASADDDAVDFRERIVARGARCVVINDEAHHTHDEKSTWNQTVRELGNALGEDRLAVQMDFSATPRFQKGTLFPWTIYDYPLKQAIIDQVVKRPMKGLTKGIKEQSSDVASTRYQAYLTAGVERWREYRAQLAPLGKVPILFVMMNSTDEADDVGDYLQRKYPEDFGGDKLLVIHTDRSGEVSKKDLDKARVLAREVDESENPVNAIVSVLMLREGWDVQNVTVVIGLRPYTSKANILPEQAIGRGLRLMFRGTGSLYVERVDIIGNAKFMEFIDQLEKDEDLELGSFDVGRDKLVIVTIAPDPEKLDFDIAMPVLSPILQRKKTLAEEIAGIDIQAMVVPPIPRKPYEEAAQQFLYEAFDIITTQKEIEREYTIPEAQTYQEVISYYAKRIAQDVKLPSQFANLVPKVQEFLQTKAFGETVDLNERSVIRAISNPTVSYVTVREFAKVLRALVVQEVAPVLANPGRKLSETPPFPYSRPTETASKTVFNLVQCDNNFERDFARFLENASDIRAFAKLPRAFSFTIEYTDNNANLRYYEPDFVAELTDGSFRLLETKGAETAEVPFKDRAARIWSENATLLTGTQWQYLKVPQKDFEGLQPSDFADVEVLA